MHQVLAVKRSGRKQLQLLPRRAATADRNGCGVLGIHKERQRSPILQVANNFAAILSCLQQRLRICGADAEVVQRYARLLFFLFFFLCLEFLLRFRLWLLASS